MTVLEGPLGDRDAWSAIGECPIEKTMSLAGQKSTMLIMREAYYGTTRFDDFARRVGLTKAATSARLGELVAAGLLSKRPYREPGQRTRHEYVLTQAGVDFTPVVWAMFEWGRTHLPNNGRLRLGHRGCGADAHVEIVCDKGHSVPFDELGMRLVPRRHDDADAVT
ncbi:winged helix-turn-helix transcriptional regulator [Mycolicibacterium bacteremicum]|uniref:Transcriptional regulator n=1 Tax=Mycolicibacterium bacteremicum TaxID=564198 RepID=A0A1W9YVH9_MYCBA|nr:helix-turn-helix domain-containing protein [Mycolicibacterium bacteremicum]MCV7434127.1 helix-turn-helix transcriptional regulator [Mycolicibacterium bacteremicum]ORA03760.1 transcriptional regulator [Mycolicibacterium bacteremicum]